MCMMPPPSRKRNSNAPSTSIEKSIKIEPGTSSDNKPLSLSMIIKTEDVDLESNVRTNAQFSSYLVTSLALVMNKIQHFSHHLFWHLT